MSFHFLSHSWEVTDLADGIMVALSREELNANTITVLADELLELVRESGRPNLYIDFGNVGHLASVVLGKLLTLDSRLRKMDGRLILCNLDSFIYDSFQATRLVDTLDIRLKPTDDAVVTVQKS
jgi:anti-anti-sigma factor